MRFSFNRYNLFGVYVIIFFVSNIKIGITEEIKHIFKRIKNKNAKIRIFQKEITESQK